MRDSNDGTGAGDSEAAPDATLAGYMDTHNRPPAFGAADGYPYTVSLEVERTPDLRLPYSGYLVFPRWAESGIGIVGHLETETLARGRSESEALEALGALSLHDVRAMLDEAVERSMGQGTP